MKFKKTLSKIACALVIFSSPIKAEEINFSWPVNVGPLNPHQTFPNQLFAQAMVYEPLIRYTEDGKLIPWLAKSWEVSEDASHYRFFLREDVKFSNGEPFDASVVKANFEQVAMNAKKFSWLELVAQIKEVKIIDDYTVDIQLKGSYYPTLHELATVRPVRFLAPSAMPDEGHTGQGIKAPIGTGPWILKESVLGVKDVFVQNPHYWGDKPVATKVNVNVIADPNARVVAFESGMLNVIYSDNGLISPDAFSRFSNNPNLHTAISKPYATRLIDINSTKPIAEELNVRQAINYAINREIISQGVFNGIEAPAHTLFSTNIPYADVDLTPYKYSTQKANSLLKSGGWVLNTGNEYRQKDGKILKLDLIYRGQDANQKAISEVLQANLKTVGIKLNLVAEENTRLWDRAKNGEFDLIFNDTWGTPFDPHAFVGAMRAPSYTPTQNGLPMKADIDALITSVLTSSDETKRKSMYQELFSTLHEQAVYIPITYTRSIAVSTKEIGEFPMGATIFDIPFEKMIK